jgi:SprT-like protein
MTDQQAQLLVEQLSLQYFNEPFVHRAYFNARLKTTGGRYLLKSHNIELNYKLYERFGLEELRGIILHELCHYHLHIKGMGYKHRDRDFKLLLKKVGAPRFCSSIEREGSTSKKMYTYECSSCKLHYSRKRRVNTNKYKCGKCLGELKLINVLNN